VEQLDPNKSIEKLDVAILMDDMVEIRKISEIFRKIGVVPSFYKDLKAFWYETVNKIPAICIIDVLKMSEGELALKNHPSVKKEELPIVFYYTEETQPLLVSAYEIFNFGLLKKVDNYAGPVKNILRRVNKFVDAEEKSRELSKSRIDLDKQLNKVVEATSRYRENEFYQNKLNDLMKEFDGQRVKAVDVFNACDNVFLKWTEVTRFSFLELSHNCQKLISPDSLNAKYKKIPTLWLGQTSNRGVEPFAQNMANQVAIDLLGGNIISIMIRGTNELPEKILFVQSSDEDFLDKFDWENLERYLSGLNNFYDAKNRPLANNRELIVGPWELMSLLDRYFFGAVANDLGSPQVMDDVYLFDVDFSNLIYVIRSSAKLRFYWSNFFGEFINKLKTQYSSIEFTATSMGVGHLAILANKEMGGDFFVALKAFVGRYPYWRHFEDVDLVIAKNIKPMVKMIPLSPEAYMRYLEDNQEEGFSKMAKVTSMKSASNATVTVSSSDRRSEKNQLLHVRNDAN